MSISYGSETTETLTTMGKMKDVFMDHQRERLEREEQAFARAEQEYLNSRKAQPAKATTQKPPHKG
ncbi:hypothetical protein ACQKHG_24740, partial [Escherichia coli]|uniref:hypothetical protein n=1 Tax=Escherichia coli TaxID=562 RepID=UPI003CFEDDDB